MKRMSKLLKISVAVLLLAFAVLAFTACGSTPTYDNASGTAGQLTWDYNADTKTLRIDGTGEIPDSANSTAVPWYSIRGGVETLKLDEKITSIGNHAFYGMSALKSVEVPKAVTKIGDYAFAFAGMSEIALPEGVVSIGNHAFESCASLKNVVLPLSVKTIGTRCFAFCGALTDAVIVSPELEAIPEEAFYRCISLNNLVLNPAMQEKVPTSAVEGAGVTMDKIAYRADAVALYKLTVTYEYEDGSQALEQHVEYLENGEPYNHLAPTIEGYTPDPSAVSGTIEGADKTEKVIYREIKVEEPTPEPEATKPAPTEKEDEGFTIGTAIALVVLVVVIAAIVVGGILLVRMDKKDTKKKPAAKNSKNKKK